MRNGQITSYFLIMVTYNNLKSLHIITVFVHFMCHTCAMIRNTCLSHINTLLCIILDLHAQWFVIPFFYIVIQCLQHCCYTCTMAWDTPLLHSNTVFASFVLYMENNYSTDLPHSQNRIWPLSARHDSLNWAKTFNVTFLWYLTKYLVLNLLELVSMKTPWWIPKSLLA
jgi:hypothetical protein